MSSWFQIRSLWRWVLCLLLCIGATLDDIDYISALRTPRTAAALRGNASVEEDSDDQHVHGAFVPDVLSSEPALSSLTLLDFGAVPNLPVLLPRIPAARVLSGRAPPTQLA